MLHLLIELGPSIETEPRKHSHIRYGSSGSEDDDFIIKVRSAYFAGSAMMVYMGKFIEITGANAGFLGRITTRIFRGVGILGLAASIVADLGHAGYFIYMKAMNPDLQFMTVKE